MSQCSWLPLPASLLIYGPGSSTFDERLCIPSRGCSEQDYDLFIVEENSLVAETN
jgi:hypothetical protein